MVSSVSSYPVKSYNKNQADRNQNLPQQSVKFGKITNEACTIAKDKWSGKDYHLEKGCEKGVRWIKTDYHIHNIKTLITAAKALNCFEIIGAEYDDRCAKYLKVARIPGTVPDNHKHTAELKKLLQADSYNGSMIIHLESFAKYICDLYFFEFGKFPPAKKIYSRLEYKTEDRIVPKKVDNKDKNELP